MSKQYLKKLKGTDTPIATRYKPAFSDSEYTGFGELYRNGKWYEDVAVFADDFSNGSTGGATSDGGVVISNENNSLKVTNSTDRYGRLTVNGLTVGKKYRVYGRTSTLFSGNYFRLKDSSETITLVNFYESGTEYTPNYTYADIIAPTSSVYYQLIVNAVAGDYGLYDNFAIVPLNDDGSIDISSATELTTPQTYLPIEVDVDDQSNLLNVDRMDFPTLVEDYVYAKNVKCDEANFVNGWKSEGMDAYACRAWVNFNGTGTVAIRASENVSSITDNGTGDYTVNFTTAMPDANYTATATSRGIAGVNSTFVCFEDTTSLSNTFCRVDVRSPTDNVGKDTDVICVAVFR